MEAGWGQDREENRGWLTAPAVLPEVLIEVETDRGCWSTRVRGSCILVGRAKTNHVILRDRSVSRHHAKIMPGPNGCVVEDLGSANGLSVRGRRLGGPTEVHWGQTIEVGSGVLVRVRSCSTGEDTVVPLLERCDDLRLAAPIHALRFSVGSDPNSSLVVQGLPALAGTLMRQGGGVWLLEEDGHLIRVDNLPEFTMGDVKWRIVDAGVERAEVMNTGEVEAGQVFASVDLDAPGGPVAVLENSATGDRCEVTAHNRVVLLYVVAKRLQKDLREGMEEERAGWCDDRDVAVGVWGRKGHEKDRGSFHVLVHRLRKDLQAAGLDPTVLEKRRGAIRLHGVVIVEQAAS